MVKYVQELDRTFGALADATRRSVLRRLSSGPCPVSELANNHEITLAGMLKHVRVLQDAGLITTLKQGRSRICAMQPDSCDPALKWLENYRKRWDRRFDSLEKYLKDLNHRKGS